MVGTEDDGMRALEETRDTRREKYGLTVNVYDSMAPSLQIFRMHKKVYVSMWKPQ